MVAIPPALLDRLQLRAGSAVVLEIEGERLIVEPKRKPAYTLEELLAGCDPAAAPSAEDRAWLDSGPMGRELL